jgi:hypothetical protein
MIQNYLELLIDYTGFTTTELLLSVLIILAIITLVRKRP